MKVSGACHCGHVAFEAEIDPERVTICHCTDCQALTGTAYRVSVSADRSAVRLTASEPKLYVKTAESGHRRRQYFCPECGSPIFTSADDDASPTVGLRWGVIRQRAELAPKKRIWARSSPEWVEHIAELPERPKE
jgi:hypothetical protein